MNRYLYTTFVSLLLLLSPVSSSADVTVSGVTFPETAKVGETELVLNGIGTRKATFFKVHVYVAALYVPSKSSDPSAHLSSDQPMHLVMEFVRSVGEDKLTDGWEAGLEKNSKNFASLKDPLAKFNAQMKDVEEGDKIKITFFPGEKVVASVGSGAEFEIAHPQFSKDLLAVWLGPEPPNSDLKEGLLGGNK